jgi:hypothetical protein
VLKKGKGERKRESEKIENVKKVNRRFQTPPRLSNSDGILGEKVGGRGGGDIYM